MYNRVLGILKIVISIHVDDSLYAGRKSDLDELYAKVNTKYKITTLRIIKKYLGFNYEWKNNEKGSPYLITSFTKNAHGIVSYYEKVTQKKAKIDSTPDFSGVSLTIIA